MQTESQKYRLSLYQTKKIIKETPAARVEAVFCTLDEKMYIKRTYPEDKREIFRALEKISGEHTPKIKEIIFDENTVVIEEYICGQRMSDYIQAEKLTAKMAYALAEQILKTLKLLHSNKIIHRDVKPDNIIVTQNGKAYLVDFGISRFYDETAEKDTERFGTVGYAPPEQFGFSQTDFRSDLYAAGVTIDELGSAAGCSPSSKIMKTAKKCRAFDPESRFDSADEALRALQKKRGILIPAIIFVLAAAGVCIFAAYALNSRIPHNTKSKSMPESISQSTFYTQPDDVAAPAPNPIPEPVPEPMPEPVPEPMPEPMPEPQNNDNNLPWVDIIECYTGVEASFVPIYPDEGAVFGTVALAEGQNEINLGYEWKNDALALTLGDGTKPEQEFIFSYMPLQSADYTTTELYAEIIFFDMDADGQSEILVALSDRDVMQGAGGQVLCNTNWRVVWCVGYTQGKGFWRANGQMEAYTNHGKIQLNFFEGRELYDGMGTIMYLVDEELKEAN